jgi:Reverse transcriptase (RNA-dependent DNA polymerase)/GAG-pre-integrase domain
MATPSTSQGSAGPDPAQGFEQQDSTMSSSPDSSYPGPHTAEQFEQQLRAQQASIEQLASGLQGLQAAVEREVSSLIEAFSKLQSATTAVTAQGSNSQGTLEANNASISPKTPERSESIALNSAISKDLNKRVYSFPEGSKLQGPSNFDQWKQALTIQLRALGVPNFTEDPSVIRALADPDQAIVLMLIRDSCSEGPQAAIAWQKDPEEAYKLLIKQYSYSAEIQRGYLYSEFHSLTFKGYQGSLEAFNADFNNLLARLALAKVIIQPIDQANQYIEALKGVFPQWAERQRFNIRVNKTLGSSIEPLNLQFLMADLLEEQRTTGSSVAKIATSYSAKSANNKSQKGKKGKSPYNSPKGFFKKKKKAPEKEPTKGSKEDSEPTGGTKASFLTGTYNLSIGALDPEELGFSSDEEPYRSIEPIEALPQTSFRAPQRPPNRFTKIDTLLYDTGSTCHIVNNKARFTTYKAYNNNDFKPPEVITAGGVVKAIGIGTAEFSVLTSTHPITYRDLVLKEALYIPTLDTSLVSGIRHYASGGTLLRERLYSADRACCGLFSFQQHGFFFKLKGLDRPKLQGPHLHYSYPLEVQIPYKDPNSYKDYIPIAPEATEPSEASESDSEDQDSIQPPDQQLQQPGEIPKQGSNIEQKVSISPELLGLQPNIGPLAPDLTQGFIQPNPLQYKPKQPKTYEDLLQSALLWHARLGHIGLGLLKKTAIVTEALPDFTAIKAPDFYCEACIRAKALRAPSKDPIPDPPRALDRLEGDTFKIKPMPYNRRPMCLLLVDRKTRYRWVFTLPNKEGKILSTIIIGFFKHLKNTYNRYPSELHFDGGTEITGDLQGWLATKGITFSTSSPYIHEQNGLAERSIRVLLDRLRAVIQGTQLPLYLWNFILPAVLGLINCTAVTNKDKTPKQLLLEDLEPSKSYYLNFQALRVIGADCEVLIPPEQRVKGAKLAPRTLPGRVLATLGSNTYQVFIPSKRLVTKTSFLTIRERIGLQRSISNPSEGENSLIGLRDREEFLIEPLGPPYQGSQEPMKPTELIVPKEPEESIVPTEPIECTEPEPTEPTEPIEPADQMDLSLRAFIYRAKEEAQAITAPASWQQALKSPYKDQWLQAIFAEYKQLLLANTFKFVPCSAIPRGRKVLKNRLVLKVKLDSQNKPYKYKARLVAKGFMQEEGLDYKETFASTSIPPTWRLVLALAASKDWEIQQVDFIGAFLNSPLKEAIYTEIPSGFKAFIEANPDLAKALRALGWNPLKKQVILLNKALYGLKQGPREWQEALKALLKSLGFYPLISDPAIYYNPIKATFIVTYVDDCLIIGPNLGYINSLKKALNRGYPLEDRGPAAFFLGVQIIRDRPKRALYLHQEQYIDQLLSTYNIDNYKALSVPIQPNVTRVTAANTGASPLGPEDHHLFQQIIGSLMYLMLLTRPDIAFAVQWLAQAMAKPYPLHLSAARKLLQYLKGTKKLAIHYKALSLEALQPIGYCDSDFAGDKGSSKSTYGYLFIVAGGPISWKSKKASTIALSTLEAESDSLTEAIRELQWLQGLYKELRQPFKAPIQVFCDNLGTITNAYNPTLHARTKHTLLKFHYNREQVLKGLLKLAYIDTKAMPADGLTKALTAPLQQLFISLLGLINTASLAIAPIEGS